MRRTKVGIVTIAVAMLVFLPSVRLSAADWESHVKKTWDFKLQQGLVKMVLLVDPSVPDVSTLEILYEDGAHPSLEEEVGFVHEVLQQLPSLGVDIHSLRAISMRGFAEPDVARRVALAALHSEAWRSYTTKIGGAERVVQDLLKSIGAYDALNHALGEYGLAVAVQSVEKVARASCLELKLGDPQCNIHHNLRVPVGANLRLAVVSRNETTSSKPRSDPALRR